ncbi:MAG: hypothetical protein E7678_00380 [Ruminococcaceae bacterium]|nr:hypothetical protein [Oscillospiraceae bacterium]
MRKYKKIESLGGEFFAAANSGHGFVSFYGEIFKGANIRRRYLIKGGPGTGKSTFMRRVADEAQRIGKTVERYRCSSDPSSLDGVIIDGSVSIIDSTAPHAEEAELIGACDVLVDLGRFCNEKGLYDEREKIKALAKKKKHAYALTYRFLSSAMQSDIASREMILPYVNKNCLVRLAKRLTRDIKSDGVYECKSVFNKAIGMFGRCELDGYESFAERVVYIEEHYGIGYLAVSEICEVARERGCKIAVFYDPLNSEIPDSVFFETSKTLFLLCEPRTRGAVSLRRALDLSSFTKFEKNELKSKSRNAKRMSDALIMAATDELNSAADAHFELEKIYRENMDFVSLDSYTSNFIQQIIDFAKD